MERRIKIKHGGPRGWANIAASAFDPAKHEVYREMRAGVKSELALRPFSGGADRESLEGRARELGVSFNARTKDEVLRQRISEAEG